jgi:hypothetical protein
MASFRNMQKFVQLVKDMHLEMAKDSDIQERVQRNGADFEWPTANDVRDKFASQQKYVDSVVSDIQDDCMAFGYLRFSAKHLAQQDYNLILTSKGRHLLLKLGLTREVFKDNSDWLNVATAFVVGILAAATPFIIYIISTRHH